MNEKIIILSIKIDKTIKKMSVKEIIFNWTELK